MPAGLDQFNQFNEDSTMVGMGFNLNDDDSWRSLDINPQFSADPAFETTAFGLDCGFNLQFPSFNSANLSFDTPASCSSSTSNFTPIFPNDSLNPSFSVVTPALVNASQPSQFIGASFMQFQPTAALAPAFPHTSALLPSRSNASSPTVTVVPGNAPQPIPAMSNASPQPTTTPSTPVSPPSHGESNQPGATPSVAGDASLPPAQNSSSQHDQAAAVSQPVHTGAKNCTTPLSPSLNSDSPLSQLASNPGTPALASDSATSSSVTADGRRSGRNPVPSKRHEQMNEIDGKAKNKTTASAHIEKENIHSTTPEWTITSHDYLLKSNLGDDWTACVQAWFELEHELGYGSQAGAKVFLLIFFLASDLILCDRERYR
jgi:hypothetical protein